MVHSSLMACFILFQCISINGLLMINLINEENVHDTNLTITQERECSNDLNCINFPMGETTDPEQSLIHVRGDLKNQCGTCEAQFSFMICKDIVLIANSHMIFMWICYNHYGLMQTMNLIIPLDHQAIYYRG